jgi:hypothetical protein
MASAKTSDVLLRLRAGWSGVFVIPPLMETPGPGDATPTDRDASVGSAMGSFG